MEVKTIQIIPENLFLIDDFETEAGQEMMDAIAEAINNNDKSDLKQEHQPTKKVSK